MSELQNTLDQLGSLPMFRAERPATQDEIRLIESTLGILLPKQYIEFLQHYGYAAWFGSEILGIRPIDQSTGEPSSVTFDCIHVTLEQRKPDNPFGTVALPQDHVVIATDGAGGNFVLFTIGSRYEGQVHWYSFEDKAEPVMAWPTFNSFLEYMIANAPGP